jgi:hypothetical protein
MTNLRIVIHKVRYLPDVSQPMSTVMQCIVRDVRSWGRYTRCVVISRGSAFDIHNLIMSSNIEKMQNTGFKKLI